MEMHFTVVSHSQPLLKLVREFAEGLGCRAEPAAASTVTVSQPRVPDGADNILSLLTYVALSAAKTGVESTEPLCQVRYRQEAGSSEVTLDLRIAGVALKK